MRGNLQTWPYVGTLRVDEKAPILDLHISAKVIRASCHWGPFLTCAYVGTVSDDAEAPILDLHLHQNLQDPAFHWEPLLSMTSWWHCK